MASPPENCITVVDNPSVEFLLKQVYAAYKMEVNLLTDKLSEANEKLSKNQPCSFCSTMTEKVEILRNQIKHILQEQQSTTRITKDVSAQTDTPLVSASPENGSKRIIFHAPPRKHLNNNQKSPAKADKSIVYNSDDEVVLAPNTPERDPQRQYRVKHWLQTLEIPETVDPDLLQGRMTDTHCSVANAVTTEGRQEPSMSEAVDLDVTNLPQNYSVANAITTHCQQAPSMTETADLDVTLLPPNYIPVNIKEELNNSQHIENDQLLHSSANSEDLLCGAILLNDNNKSILADVGNMALGKQNHTANKKGPMPFKYKDEPVRKKQDRRRLPAHQCTDCAKYYQGDKKGEQYRNVCSRHRATHGAPATPEHFWELDFPDSQVCRERGYLNKTQKVNVLSRRKRPLVQ